MNTLLDKIKNDTFSGIFELTEKSWKPVTAATILNVVLSTLVMVPLMMSAFGLSLERIEALEQMSADPMGMQREMENMVEIVRSQISMSSIVTVVLAIVLLSLISCWIYYIAFRTMKVVIDGGKPNLGEILSSSFSPKVLNVFLAYWAVAIIFMVLYLATIFVLTLLGSFSPVLAVLLGISSFIFLFAYMIRFIITMPIVAMEDISTMDALRESLKAIPLRKGFKYMLIGFLSLLVLGIVSMVVGLIFGLLAAIPVVGIIFTLIGNVLISGLTVTLMAALLMSLYYKYRVKDSNGELEDHLLYEN